MTEANENSEDVWIQTIADPMHQQMLHGLKNKPAVAKAESPAPPLPYSKPAPESPPHTAETPNITREIQAAPSEVVGETNEGARRFWPRRRQPLARLTIIDDDSSSSGEVIRLRKPKFSIGRTHGDLVLPFDFDVSGQHAELRCERQKDGGFRWSLVDRTSKNGTYLRVFRAVLPANIELLLGSRRYVFQECAPKRDELEFESWANQTFDRNENLPAGDGDSPTSMLRTLKGRKPVGPEFAIGEHELTIGRSASSDCHVDGDPFLCNQHARLSRNAKGQQVIEDLKSLNGLWIRVLKMKLAHRAEFMIGQQRFIFEQCLQTKSH